MRLRIRMCHSHSPYVLTPSRQRFAQTDCCLRAVAITSLHLLCGRSLSTAHFKLSSYTSETLHICILRISKGVAGNMATVHPSRMALVRQDPPKDLYSQTRERRRTLSPRPSRRRSPSPPRDQRRDRKYGRYDRRDRGTEDGGRPERGRARADDYFDEASSGGEGPAPHKRTRSKSVDRERDREREERRERGKDKPRRASPEYSEYRRLSPPREGSAPAPWRQQENMYPRGRDMGRFVAGGADFMERYVIWYGRFVTVEC